MPKKVALQTLQVELTLPGRGPITRTALNGIIKRLREKAKTNKRNDVKVTYQTEGRPPRKKAYVSEKSARLVKQEFYSVHWRSTTMHQFGKVS